MNTKYFTHTSNVFGSSNSEINKIYLKKKKKSKKNHNHKQIPQKK